MTADQDLSARLADHLSKEAWYVDMLETQGRDYYDPPYENKLKDYTNKACGDAYRSGQLITLADHEARVAAERERIIAALREEASVCACYEDQVVIEDCADLIEADFSYEDCEKLKIAREASAKKGGAA